MPLQLFPYQETGADWIARRERGGLLDVPGLGKSAQIIRALDLRRSRRVLLVCPAHLRSNWAKEFRMFAHVERRVCAGRNIHDLVAWTRGVFDVMIISYEMAVKWSPLLDEHTDFIDALPMDEFHYLSNLETARARAVIGADGDGRTGIAKWALQGWPTTGTLMTNDPANCYAFLRFTRALELPFGGFVRRYFHTRTSTWGQRNKPKQEMLPELQSLIANNSIRRTFDEVGIELPPVFLTTMLIDGDTTAIRSLLAEHPGLDHRIVDAVKEGGLSFLDAQHIGTLRMLTAQAKALPYSQMLLGELQADPDRKVVVMGVHREPLASIRDYLARHGIWAVLVQGGVSSAAREDAVTSFQSNPNCRVFLANMDAGGTGLTLTAAAHLDMFEYDWRPATNDQAIRRIRRLTQTRAQHIRFIILANSFDEKVGTAVAEKTRNIAMVEGDGMIATPEAAA